MGVFVSKNDFTSEVQVNKLKKNSLVSNQIKLTQLSMYKEQGPADDLQCC